MTISQKIVSTIQLIAEMSHPRAAIRNMIKFGFTDGQRHRIYRWLSVLYEFFQPDLHELRNELQKLGWVPGTLSQLNDYIACVNFFMPETDTKSYYVEALKIVAVNKDIFY